MCNDLQSSAARPDFIGQFQPSFVEIVGGVKSTLCEIQPGLFETNLHSSAWDRNP
jgi:hypothetical protein